MAHRHHQPIAFRIVPDIDAALRCGMEFVRQFKNDFDSDDLATALQFCDGPEEREFFMLAVVDSLVDLNGGKDL